MNSKERLLVIILACVNFTHIMDFMIMMPLGPQFMSLFHITPQQFGFAVSSYSLTAGVSGFLSAFFVDRFDRKNMLLFAYTGFVVGTFACAMAPSYEWLVAARILAGLFGGMIGAQVLSIVGDTFEYARRASAMGVLMMAFSVASVVGVPSGLWLATHFGWHAPFMVIAGLGLCIIALVWFFVPALNQHKLSGKVDRNPLHVLTNVLQSVRQRRAILLSFTLILGHFITIPFITPALIGNAHFGQGNIFLIYLVGGACTIVTSPWVGKIADKRGKFPVFMVFALLSLIPVWCITHLWTLPMWAILCVAAMFFIFANGRVVPVQAMVSNVVLAEQRGSFMSINSSVQQLSMGLAANLGGVIVVKHEDGFLEHYDWVGYLSMLLIVTSVWLAWRVEDAVKEGGQ